MYTQHLIPIARGNTLLLFKSTTYNKQGNGRFVQISLIQVLKNFFYVAPCCITMGRGKGR